MNPDHVLLPFLEEFGPPEKLVELIFYLLELEVEDNLLSLSYDPKYDEDDPALRYAKGLLHVFSRLPTLYDVDDGMLSAEIGELAGIDMHDPTLLRLASPSQMRWYERQKNRIKEQIAYWEKEVEEGSSSASSKRFLREYRTELKELIEPPPETLIAHFWRVLIHFRVSFELTHRNEHCHILGAPGTGKTALIKFLAHRDIRAGASVIAMAPKGNLIRTLSKLPSDDITWVHDWKQVGLNLLDLDIDMLIWVLESLVESEPTPKQKGFLTKCAAGCKNLGDLRAQIKKPEPKFRETAEQLEWRLDLLLGNPVIEGIFTRETNINIQSVMDDGGVLLLDTQTLGEMGSAFIGRFIVALISRAVRSRQTKRPCYVYLDEFPQYTTDHITSMLDLAREANVCLILAHQTLSQLSPRLKASIHNTAIKFVGKCNYEDASEMGRQMSVDSSALKDQERLHFMLYGFKRPFQIQVDPGYVDRLAAHQREHFVSPRPQPTIAEAAPEEEKGTTTWR